MTENITSENSTAQKAETNRIASTLNEIFKAKGVKYKVFGLILLTLLSITTIVLKSMKKNSANNVATGTTTGQTTENGGAGFSPDAEIDIPQDQIQKAQSNPEIIVNEFLEYTLEDDRTSASTLLSSRVNRDAFRSTLENVDNDTSLYGKGFDYNIFDTYIEKNGNLSRISVEINVDGRSYVNVYILLWENGVWQLLDREVYIPAVIDSEEQ